MRPQHIGTVSNGKLTLDNKEFFTWDVLNFEGQEVYLTINLLKPTRSNNMNRYYWGVIVGSLTQYVNEQNCFGQRIDTDTMHSFLKQKFLGNYKLFINQEEILIPNATKQLSNSEFIAYFESIIQWAAGELGLELPLPNEF